MIDTLVYDGPYMVICQEIYYLFAFSSVSNELALLKDLKLMGYGRLGHIKAISYIADTHLLFKQGKENSDPCGVAEDLEQFCQIVKLIIIGHLSVDLQHHICVLVHYIAMFYIIE